MPKSRVRTIDEEKPCLGERESDEDNDEEELKFAFAKLCAAPHGEGGSGSRSIVNSETGMSGVQGRVALCALVCFARKMFLGFWSLTSSAGRVKERSRVMRLLLVMVRERLLAPGLWWEMGARRKGCSCALACNGERLLGVKLSEVRGDGGVEGCEGMEMGETGPV